MIVTYNRAGLDIAAAKPVAGRRDRIVAAVAWAAVMLAVLALCDVAAVADLALSDMPDEVTAMMGLPVAAPR